jgi:hypothetical protein
MNTYFAIIRVPHDASAQIYFNAVDDRKTIENTIDWNATIAEYRSMWQKSNPHIPFIEPDTIDYDYHTYRKGDIVYDSFWDDVNRMYILNTELELVKLWVDITSAYSKPHQWSRIIQLIENYIISEYSESLNFTEVTPEIIQIIITILEQVTP